MLTGLPISRICKYNLLLAEPHSPPIPKPGCMTFQEVENRFREIQAFRLSLKKGY